MTLSKVTADSAGQVRWQAEGQVAVVEINHPGQLTALTVAMWAQLRNCFAEISARHPEASADVTMVLDFLAATTPQRGIVR